MHIQDTPSTDPIMLRSSLQPAFNSSPDSGCSAQPEGVDDDCVCVQYGIILNYILLFCLIFYFVDTCTDTDTVHY